MAFREKMAWLTLLTMLVAYGTYFTAVAQRWGDTEPPVVPMLVLFAGITIAQVAIITIATIILAVTAQKDANARADERDTAIARRGSAIAYTVLMIGMILVGVIMPFGDHGTRITNAAILALVVAEAVRQIVIVACYRRGWHG